MTVDISPPCPKCGDSMLAHRALGGKCPEPWVDVIPMNDAALRQMEAQHGPAPQHAKDNMARLSKMLGL